MTLRTVRRDVDRLRDLGYPVAATPGAAGGYRLEAGAAMPPLLLDDDEAVAVAVGLRTAAGGTIAGIEETSVRALAKLEQVLPARLRRRVHALGSSTVSLARRRPDRRTGAAHPAGHRVPRPRVAAAALHPGGRHRRRGGWSSRCASRAPAAAGTCSPGTASRRSGARSGSTGSPARPRRARGSRRANHRRDVAGYISRAISSAPYRHQATIRLHVPAEVAAERVSPAAGLIEAVDEDSCLLHVGGPSLAEFPVYVAQIGFEFEVLSPPELVEQVRVLAGLFGRAAAR